MDEMAGKTGQAHLEELKEVHRELGKLRDPEVGSGTSVADLLVAFEDILRRRNMPELWVIILRQKNWKHYDQIIRALGKPGRGGHGHVSVSGGLPSLGKRRWDGNVFSDGRNGVVSSSLRSVVVFYASILLYVLAQPRTPAQKRTGHATRRDGTVHETLEFPQPVSATVVAATQLHSSPVVVPRLQVVE
jgi:hypothetical protein